MKKIICNVEVFDLYQKIQIADTDTGEIDLLAECIRDDLEETIAQLCYENKISKVLLMGHPSFNNQLAIDILEYSKSKYGISDNNLEVEVL